MQYQDRNDGELIELAKNDPEIFGVLMERYEKQLYHYIRRIGQLRQEDAEDLLQEVFIKIYQKLNEYTEVLKFSSWAYRIAHNHVIDYFRKMNSRPQLSALQDEEWEKLIASSVEMENDFINRDCAEKIKLAISDLPMKYKEVLILRYVEEKEYEEIMDILKKPKGSVATLIARGKTMLIREMHKNNQNCFDK